METLTAANHRSTPHTVTSPVHESSRINPAATSPKPTRTTQATATVQPLSLAPGSQDSVASDETGIALQSHSNRSSIGSSQNTTYTDLTSPSSSVASMAMYDGTPHGPKQSPRPRHRTPERVAPSVAIDDESILFSPMSITSPVSTNGAKRTASGHVKNASSMSSLPTTPIASNSSRQSNHRSRQQSISSTGSRASELAASLKTRLGYAMAKVHHGWEHKSLIEVEQLAAHQLSPNRFSNSHQNGRSVTGAPSNGPASYDFHARASSDQPVSPPSKRHSRNYSSYLHSLHPGVPTTRPNPQLQPAVEFRPSPGYRHPQPVQADHVDHSMSAVAAMSPPCTPISDQPHRPPILRTQTQTAEAERDALQALFQLGSPRGSQFPHAFASNRDTPSQASPLRSEFSTPRKATFGWSDSSGRARSFESGGASRPSEAA